MNPVCPAVLPLLHLGNIFFFRQLVQHSAVWVDDTENYQKQTFRNRYRILAANGPMELTVPIESTKGIPTPINQISISHAENWPIKHWRSLVSAYSASPFFEEWSTDFKPLILEKDVLLADRNKKLLTLCCDLLGVDTPISFISKTASPEDFHDFRSQFKPNLMPTETHFIPYQQVFGYKYEFVANLSILDLLFNVGPAALNHLMA